ncbi:MAG: hypothetical protein K0S76_161 [Herbinix sp.]|jgi:hypothetical protein|nr:hypothetical protein [Herbinix sp.]
MKKIISFVVLFAVLITLAPQHTPTVSAATTTEVEKVRAKLDTAWEKYISTLTGWDKSRMRTLKNEWDKYGGNDPHMPGGKTWEEELAKDCTMIRSGVEVPRPCNLWELVGFPSYAVGLDYTQGVKIKSNWDVYLEGLGSDLYSVSVKNNTLKITGKNDVSSTKHVYSVRGKFQLFKPTKGMDAYVGEDGLAYAESRGNLDDTKIFVKNAAVINSDTLILAPDPFGADADADAKRPKTLSYEIDLSDLSDGLYCIKELVWYASPGNHKSEEYWSELVVVVHNGVASLQAVDICWGTVPPKATEGRITYGSWYSDASVCSEGYIGCGSATCGGW